MFLKIKQQIAFQWKKNQNINLSLTTLSVTHLTNGMIHHIF